MQTVVEEKLIPERALYEDDDEYAIEHEKDFINTHDDDGGHDDDDDEDDDDDDDEEFSFMSQFGGELTEKSLISADDAFVNGQIKTVLPLFNQQLVLSDHHESLSLHEHDFPKNPPPVRKIFVQTKENEDYHHKNGRESHPATSSLESDVISGPYCDLSSRKVVEVTPPSSSSTSDTCTKSNSTGFSKIWRFKDFVGRSNSDGRDAFVFLSEAHAPAKLKRIDEKRAVVDKSIGKVKKVNKRGDGKKKTSSYSAHEAYLRNKVKGDNKKRSSYLPYKPELMGFFTNVNGGLTKNVHPF